MKEYNMTPQEAQELWVEWEALKECIKALKEEQNGLSGPARGKVTRQITPLKRRVVEIKEQLQDAPPPPMTPEEGLAKLREVFAEITGAYESARETFEKSFARNPKGALEWCAEKVVKAQTVHKMFSHAMQVDADGGSFEDVVEAIGQCQDQARRDFKSASGHICNSTSMAHNVVKVFEVEALSDIVYNRSWPAHHLDWKAEYLGERVAVYRALEGQSD